MCLKLRLRAESSPPVKHWLREATKRFKLPIACGNVKIGCRKGERPVTRVNVIGGTLEFCASALARGILVIGPPGTGKTVFITNIIKHMELSHKLLIFAPKGDLAQLVRERYPRAKMYATTGKTELEPFKWNIFKDAYIYSKLGLGRPENVFELLAESASQHMSKEHSGWAAIGKALITALLYYVYQVETKVTAKPLESPYKYLPTHADMAKYLEMDVKRLVSTLVEAGEIFAHNPTLKRLVKQAEEILMAGFGGDVANSYGVTLDMISGIFSAEAFRREGHDAFLDLYCSDAFCGNLDAVYIRLSDLGDEEKMRLNAMIHTAMGVTFKAASTKPPKYPILTVLDDFVAIGKLKDLANYVNIGRGIGLWTIVTTQYVSQLKADEEKALQDAFSTVIAYSVSGETAEWLSKRIGKLAPKRSIFSSNKRSLKEEYAQSDPSVDVLNTPCGVAILSTTGVNIIGVPRHNAAVVWIYDCFESQKEEKREGRPNAAKH